MKLLINFVPGTVCLQPDDSLVTVGMTDGLLSMQRRKDDKQLAAEFEEKKKRRKNAMKRRFKSDAQYKASKVSLCSPNACYIHLRDKTARFNSVCILITYTQLSCSHFIWWMSKKDVKSSFICLVIIHYMQEDSVIEHKRKQKLARYDRFFRRFEYSKAMDAAMMVNLSNLHTAANTSTTAYIYLHYGVY